MTQVVEKEKTFEERVKEYSELTMTSLEIARHRVTFNDEVDKKIEKASICPRCGNHSLAIESDGGDYSFQSWVECNNYDGGCDFTDDCEKPQYEPLVSWFQFDVVLMFAVNELKELGKENMTGMLGMTWEEFVDKDTKEKLNQSNQNH